jgi:hypothetical protein
MKGGVMSAEIHGGANDTRGPAQPTLELLLEVARIQVVQGALPAASKTLDTVSGRLREAHPAMRIRYLVERSRLLLASGDHVKAESFMDEAWAQGQLAVPDPP